MLTTQARIQQTITEMETIISELEEIESDCRKSSANNDVKAKKRKWIPNRSKISKLLDRARRAKTDLVDAMQWQHNTESSGQATKISDQTTKISSQTMKISNRTTEISNQTTQILDQNTQILDQNAAQLAFLLQFRSDFFSELSSLVQNSKDSQRIQELPETDDSNPSLVDDEDSDKQEESTLQLDDIGSRPVTKSRFEGFNVIEQLSLMKCPPNCRCRCHSESYRHRSPRWAQQMIGSWLLSYRSGSDQGRARWDLQCACSKQGYIALECRLPQWLRRLGVFPKPSSTIRYALRLTRTISHTEFVWVLLHEPVAKLESFIQRGEVVLPDDQGEDGAGLVEVRMPGPDAFVGESASEARALETFPLSDHQQRLLGKVALHVDDGEEFVTTKLHKAAAECRGIDEALLEDSSAIDELGAIGDTPLMLAITAPFPKGDRVEALQKLIDAKADVNGRNYVGRTPLHFAAYLGDTKCMQRLLDANCRIDERDDSGNTPLHLAVGRGSADAVRLLLQNGASASTRNLWGQTPLHRLASRTTNSQETEQLSRLLLKAENINLDAKNSIGQIPVLSTLRSDYLPVLRCLVEAGASLAPITDRSWGVLHYAAAYATSDTLRYLAHLDLDSSSGIDTDLRDSSNCTPWDIFLQSFYRPPWSNWRRCTSDDQSAFVQLYQAIRDRNLQHEISVLEHVLHALPAHVPTVCNTLNSLSKQKADCHVMDSSAWYRAVSSKLRTGEQDAAIHDMEDYLDDLRYELDISLWDELNEWLHGNREGDSDDSFEQEYCEGEDDELSANDGDEQDEDEWVTSEEESDDGQD
ncbi:hypothetical protein B0T10DRAFT_549678 [Thelonectria olida]|uniref:Uncharacterized protein n=1 Tax=Thelonectria olida TaxID=1576542 RepID=A0A9P8W2J1_9HYPO|nr:hypothetical protein B0T10DRAFT_549678 [Thelonectria olida]